MESDRYEKYRGYIATPKSTIQPDDTFEIDLQVSLMSTRATPVLAQSSCTCTNVSGKGVIVS